MKQLRRLQMAMALVSFTGAVMVTGQWVCGLAMPLAANGEALQWAGRAGHLLLWTGGMAWVFVLLLRVEGVVRWHEDNADSAMGAAKRAASSADSACRYIHSTLAGRRGG